MDFPDKSKEDKTPKKDLTPVVSGASKVSRPATRRFLDFVFAESPRAVAGKIVRDIVLVRLKSGFEEAANGMLHGILWGNQSPPPSSGLLGRTVLRGNTVAYNQISNSPMAQAHAASSVKSSGNYQDLIVPSQDLAETLLARMYDLLNQYRVVSVADLYELAEIETQISDNSYGWRSLDGARIRPTGGGYILELPRPTLIT